MAIKSPTEHPTSITDKPSVHLSWYDVILMAVLSLSAFGIGGFVSGLAGSLGAPPVAALSVFQANAGVPAASNNLETIEDILGALRDRTASEYASSANGGAGAGTNDQIVTKLRATADGLVVQESRAQVALSDVTDQASAARSRQLSVRRWKEILIRVAVSTVCYLLLAGVIVAISAWSKIAVKWGSVLGCAAMLLLAFLAADIATWVAALVLLFVVVTLFISDRRRQVPSV